MSENKESIYSQIAKLFNQNNLNIKDLLESIKTSSIKEMDSFNSLRIYSVPDLEMKDHLIWNDHDVSKNNANNRFNVYFDGGSGFSFPQEILQFTQGDHYYLDIKTGGGYYYNRGFTYTKDSTGGAYNRWGSEGRTLGNIGFRPIFATGF